MFKKFIISITLLLSFFVSGFSQTTLNPGDIAIIAMNCDGGDEFSFVLLTPITNGTVIKFAESGWLSAGGFRGGGDGSEGVVTWTASSALACGTEVTITSNGSAASSGSTSISGSWALSTSGDQILAYQGTAASPTFIYAVNNEGAGVWQADATTANNSAIPTGLTNGTNAVALVEADNQRYDCSTTTPPAAILSAVSNNSNWLSDNTTPYSLPLNCGFTCAACVADAEPTTNASSLILSNIGCFSMDLSWTNGNGANRIVVVSTSPIAGTPTDQTAYTANTIFGNGDPIAAGEFVVYNNSGSSVTISGLSVTTTYHVAIFEYNGAIANCEENYFTTGMVTGSDITLFCAGPTCPELTGILVDACGGAIEGINELFTFTNGNNSLSLDSFSTTFPSAGTYCNSGCGTNTWVTNPVYVDSLNSWASCPGLFVETDPIPPNGKVIVFTGSSPTYNFDFNGLCGTGPYYAVFANNTSTSGRFANYSSCSVRTLRADFGTDCSDTVSYDRCLLTGGATHDGDFVTYDAAGNPSYLNNGCTPTAILPITLINFNGHKQKNGTNSFKWVTSSEINNEYFSIERSENALEFTEIGSVNGAGNSNTTLYYNFIDDSPLFDINYYRLRQTDFNGNYSYSDIIALDNSKNEANIFISNHSLQINLDNDINNGSIEIFDAVGRIIYSDIITSSKKININNFNSGIYIVKVSRPTGNTIQKVKF